LAYGLLAMQTALGLFGLFVRHRMALWIFSLDNRGYGGGMSSAV
jgi:UDP-N-acetylglucosamine--dolichyl-phosphate N-acetylglucosaminephosphotransferase